MLNKETEARRVIMCLERPELENFARRFCSETLPRLEIKTRSIEQFIDLLNQPRDPEELLLLALGTESTGQLSTGPTLIQRLMTSHVPVLVIREPQQPGLAPMTFNRVVVPLDGSTVAGQAVPIASRVAQMNDLPVKFVMVIDPERVIPPAYAHDPEAWGVIEELRITADWALSQAESRMKHDGVSAQSELLLGSTNASLMASIGEHDLVVMTTHGLNRRNLRYGDSVAMRVLANTHQPILIMQAEEEEPIVVECERVCSCAEPIMNSHVRIA